MKRVPNYVNACRKEAFFFFYYPVFIFVYAFMPRKYAEIL